MLLQERKTSVTDRVPPHVFFFVSAIFHYLGPSFAVLLYSSVSVLGVAWFRIASAAVVFAVWRRPWRLFASLPWAKQRIVLALGLVLGLMNACFYRAIARLPLGTVGAIEFLGPIVLASLGVRTARNCGALVLAGCMPSSATASPRIAPLPALIAWAQRCSSPWLPSRRLASAGRCQP